MTRLLTMARIVWLEILRRKDVYLVFLLFLGVLISLSSINVFGLGAVSGYVKEIGLLFGWIFSWIIAVSVAARALPEEESRGTIFPLLARPVSRAHIVIGKWLGSWMVACAATAAFYLALIMIAVLRGGGFLPASLLQALSLHLLLLGAIAAMGVAFSTRLNFDAAAALTYVLSLAAFSVLPHTPSLILSAKGFERELLLFIYYALPHFELFDLRTRLVQGMGPVPIGLFFQLVAYGVGLICFFLLLGWAAYRTKRFSRGVME